METNSLLWTVLLSWVIPGLLILIALLIGGTVPYVLWKVAAVIVRDARQIREAVNQPTDAINLLLSQLANQFRINLSPEQSSKYLLVAVAGLTAVAEALTKLAPKEEVNIGGVTK